MNIVAFLTYVIVTSITPGPSNILMMNEARKFGFIGSWRFNGGILAGFGLLGIISGVFTTSLYHWLPVLGPYFKWAGAAYMLYLVWLMIGNKSSEKDSRDVQSSFLSGVMLQLINVKSILFFLTVMSAFILPYMTVKEDVERGKLKIVSHSEQFDPIYSHMLIKKKKWLSPAVKAFSELVIKSISVSENESDLIH
ncbi:LysE family translocator [Paenibacillus tundrae]|uniref:LysE family translocator n=1 Tax=Paenibacillus tundrae TaxID=528187 RepID=UPI0022A9C28B|nr:LysE family transporter [Paenibacillus tundrae]MCZ1269427.1 hypothetical protein [Paenibacillus tundrae]